MSHFINDRPTIVTEAIEAEVLLSGGLLQRLEGQPAIKVVVRADWDRSRVAVVSGGGAGHEPAHVGFVGEGMLTAAVCGEIFASPSVDAVLAAIVTVTGSAGCLLIVKNYTGDRLNFGLAAEKARAMGLSVEMVIVGDDVALPGVARPRGIAGTLFVHKVAGHVARSGGSLADVKRAAERAAGNVVSIGVALSSCNVPGQTSENRIGPDEAELGLGIHGEPGAKVIPLRPIRELAATMMELLESALATHAAAPVALLINDLGSVPPIEMALAARAAVQAAREREVRLVFGPARWMTSLDMRGFSISALVLDGAELEGALLSSVGPRAWLPGRAPHVAAPVPLPSAIRSLDSTPSADTRPRRLLEQVCDALVSKQGELDAVDARVGDGDTGTTLATAARAILADLDSLPFADLPKLFGSLSDRLARATGGSSGALLAIFTAAVGARVGAEPLHVALEAGVRRVEEYGGARPGDRTMLDALVPAIEALGDRCDLAAAARAAAEGAARTASMSKAGAGRSSLVREEALRGVPDPGALAVAAVFAKMAES